MTRDDLIEAMTAKAAGDARVQALFLGGSLGKGEGDPFSDADFILAVTPEAHADFVAGARDWAAEIVPLVLWKPPYPGLPLFTALGEGWQRFDLTITVPGRVTGARATLKALVDKAEVWAGLPETLPVRPLQATDVEAITEETMRILGLLSVGTGREEWAVAATGAALLRGQLVALMVAETQPPLPPGALSLKRILPASDVAILDGLPGVTADREAVVGFSVLIARLFLPRARAALARCGGTWPQALEDALRAHWRRSLGLELPESV